MSTRQGTLLTDLPLMNISGRLHVSAHTYWKMNLLFQKYMATLTVLVGCRNPMLLIGFLSRNKIKHLIPLLGVASDKE